MMIDDFFPFRYIRAGNYCEEDDAPIRPHPPPPEDDDIGQMGKWDGFPKCSDFSSSFPPLGLKAQAPKELLQMLREERDYRFFPSLPPPPSSLHVRTTHNTFFLLPIPLFFLSFSVGTLPPPPFSFLYVVVPAVADCPIPILPFSSPPPKNSFASPFFLPPLPPPPRILSPFFFSSSSQPNSGGGAALPHPLTGGGGEGPTKKVECTPCLALGDLLYRGAEFDEDFFCSSYFATCSVDIRNLDMKSSVKDRCYFPLNSDTDRKFRYCC